MTEPVMVGGDEPSSASRLPLLLGIGAALLLAVIVLPGLLGGGDDADDEFDFGVTPTTGAPTTAPPGDVDATLPPRTFEIFSSKNPFTPLVDTGAGTAPGTGTSPDGGTVTSPPPPDGSVIIVQPDGTTTSSPPPDDGSTTTTTQPGSTEPRPAQRVALLEVFTSDDRVVATVRVNDTVYEVGEGDSFASNYRVVSLSLADRCGQFLFGDDRFRLCEGEQLLK